MNMTEEFPVSVKRSDFPDCCAASILYYFWKLRLLVRDETNDVYKKRIDKYLTKNIEVDTIKNIRFSIVILKHQQYIILKDVFKKHGYEVVSVTLGNAGEDIYLLVKKTREHRL